ncbi:LamG-like jellyroll fold domain-containing protein [Mucisphaera sp.]|uniref:LamG-like jellyroll fold domain-containing protein n=1 Tax=Mucisphaera sp. TaxID=2913024 RepID=UPI003D0F4988
MTTRTSTDKPQAEAWGPIPGSASPTRNPEDNQTRPPRGVALLLVLALLAIGSSMALAFVSAQSTTLAISENLRKKQLARTNAEMTLYAVSRYLEAQPDWRNLLTEGQIVTGFAGSTVTLNDGIDTNDDGTIDGDNDLIDDPTEPITLTVTTTVQGVSHTVSRAFYPAIGAGGPTILMIVNDETSLSTQEQLRTNFLGARGYNVALVNASAPQPDIDAAIDEADIIYIPTTASTASLGTKLNEAYLGIVSEPAALTNELGLTAANSAPANGNQITLTDTAHPILDGFAPGTIPITTSTTSLARHTPSVNADTRSLADNASGSAILAMETASIRHDSTVTPARRVVLPWGGTSFDFASLNSQGQTILTQALDWAGAGASRIGNARLLAFYNFIPGDPLPPQLVAHWQLDDNAPDTTGGGILLADDLKLWNGSSIDSYSAAAGPYGGSNIAQNAHIATNATDTASIEANAGTIAGDVAIGPSGSIPDVIRLYAGATITGTTDTLDNPITITALTTFTDITTSLGDRTDDTSATIGTDGVQTNLRYNNWTLNAGAIITIHGQVRIRVDQFLTLNDGQILLAPNATLDIAIANDVTLHNNTAINPDTTRTADLSLRITNPAADLTLDNASIAGQIDTAGSITLDNGSTLYGSIISGNDIIANNGSIHLDTDLPSVIDPNPSITIADARNANPGTTSGPILADQPGHTPASDAITFNGTDTHIEVPHDNSLSLYRGTISFWFRANDLTDRQGLITKDASGRSQGGHLRIELDDNRLRVTSESKSSTYSIQSASDLSTDTWYHAAYLFGPSGMRLYIDGALVDTDSHSGTIGDSTGGPGNTERWAFAASNENSSAGSNNNLTNFFDGRLDDIRIYTDELSTTQLAQIIAAQEPSPEPNPALVEDRSGYGVPANLYINDPDHITWIDGGGILINSHTSIDSPGPVEKLAKAINDKREFSLVVDYHPNNITSYDQDLVSYQTTDSQTNVEVEQRYARFNIKIRRDSGYTSTASSNILSGQREVMVITHDGTTLRWYLDGVERFSVGSGGAPNFLLGSDLTLAADGNGRGRENYLGRIYRVAFYDGALSEQEIVGAYSQPSNFAGNAPARPARWVWNERE